jgi:hypothetical protein
MTTDHSVLATLSEAAARDCGWSQVLRDFALGEVSTGALHLAVFVEPYLAYVLDGRKTVESRFSAHRVPPFGQLQRGDVLLLKRAGGPIVGICRVGGVWFYRLEPNSWSEIRDRFGRQLCVDNDEFWQDRSHASYATLMQLEDVRALDPVEIHKRDRRGWVVLTQRAGQMELSLA